MKPLRMCVVCRQMKEKDNLIRIVKNSDNYFLDKTFKADGRGCYVCKNNECIEKCVKIRAINKSFKTKISDDIYDQLIKEKDGQN